MKIRALLLPFLFSILSLSSCAFTPYTYGNGDISQDGVHLAAGEPQIERGEPYWFLDGLGHYVISLPAKLLLWNWDAENHHISEETEAVLAKYLAENKLSDVKIRLNQYSPGDEWSRLVDNESVGPGWRYTFGFLSWLGYTIFPGRIFGGDSYNPFTNTVRIYSDIPVVALHEGGHAKDFADTPSKGTYAVVGILPLASLFYEAQASGDAISYVQDRGCKELEKSSYKVLYPAYTTYIAGESISLFAPVNTGIRLLGLAALIPAHIIGRVKASHVEDSCEAASPSQEVASSQPKGE